MPPKKPAPHPRAARCGSISPVTQQDVGWVERSDTHQLHLMEVMGFAGSTHPTC
jgi:hypothetical protein